MHPYLKQFVSFNSSLPTPPSQWTFTSPHFDLQETHTRCVALQEGSKWRYEMENKVEENENHAIWSLYFTTPHPTNSLSVQRCCHLSPEQIGDHPFNDQQELEVLNNFIFYVVII